MMKKHKFTPDQIINIKILYQKQLEDIGISIFYNDLRRDWCVSVLNRLSLMYGNNHYRLWYSPLVLKKDIQK